MYMRKRSTLVEMTRRVLYEASAPFGVSPLVRNPPARPPGGGPRRQWRTAPSMSQPVDAAAGEDEAGSALPEGAIAGGDFIIMARREARHPPPPLSHCAWLQPPLARPAPAPFTSPRLPTARGGGELRIWRVTARFGRRPSPQAPRPRPRLPTLAARPLPPPSPRVQPYLTHLPTRRGGQSSHGGCNGHG